MDIPLNTRIRAISDPVFLDIPTPDGGIETAELNEFDTFTVNDWNDSEGNYPITATFESGELEGQTISGYAYLSTDSEFEAVA